MTFKEHTLKKLQLIEEKVYSYNIPKDKELMMYDFYLMTYVDSLIKEGKTEPGPKTNAFGETEASPTLAMGVKPSTMASFEHIKTQIVDYLKPELLESAFYSIACEFRHVWDNNSTDFINQVFTNDIDQQIFEYYIYYFSSLNAQLNISNTDAQKTFKKRKEKYKQASGEDAANSEEYFHSYMAAKKVCKKLNISQQKFVEVAAKAFNKYHGRSSDHREEDNEEYQNRLDQWNSYMKKYEQAKKEWEEGKDLHHMTYKQEMQLFRKYGIQPSKDKPVITQFPDPPEKPKKPENTTKNLSWSGSYGGRPWHNIAVAYLKLYNAKTEFEKILYIDNIYHQQHNTGTVFNKLQKYYKAAGSYRWILDALNFKANAKNNWERIKKSMELLEGKRRGFDNMMIEILKASGDKSWEQYMGKTVAKSSPKQELFDFRDWVALKNDPNHQDMLTTKGEAVVYVGKGMKLPVLADKLGVLYKELYSSPNANHIVDKGYKGDVANKDYYITSSKWKEIFGDLEKQAKKTDDNQGVAITPEQQPVVDKYINYAKQSPSLFKQAYDNGYVWMGLGIHQTGIIKDLAAVGIKLSTEDLKDNKFQTNKHLWGTVPDWNYFVKKDVWEKLFNKKLEDIVNIPTTLKTGNDQFDKEYFINNAIDGEKLFPYHYSHNYIWMGKGLEQDKFGGIKGALKRAGLQVPPQHSLYPQESGDSHLASPLEFGNASDWDYFMQKGTWEQMFGDTFENIKQQKITKDKNASATNHQGKKWVDIAKEKPPIETANITYVYIGKGQDDPSLTDQLEKLIKTESKPKIDIHNVVFKTPSGVYVAGSWGKNDNIDYYLLKSDWEKIFGPVPPITAPTPKPEPANKEKFVNLAKEGMKKFPILFGKNYIYVGTGDPSRKLTNQLNISPNDLKSSGTLSNVDNMNSFTHSNSGSDPQWKYYLEKEKWEELFGPIPTSNSGRNKLDKEKFVNLAKEGMKKYPNLFAQNYVYIGKGNMQTPLVDQLGISAIDLKSSGTELDVDNTDYFSSSNTGTSSEWKYYLEKEKWEELFGPLTDALGSSNNSENNPKEEYIKLAKYGEKEFPKLHAKNYVYIGTGDSQVPLKTALGIDSADLYSVDIDNIPHDNIVAADLSSGNSGSLPDWHYFTTKEVWEKIFGSDKNQKIELSELLPHNILSKNGVYYYIDNSKPTITSQKTIVSDNLRCKVKNFASEQELKDFIASFDTIQSWNYSVDMIKSPVFNEHFAPKLKGKFFSATNMIIYSRTFPKDDTLYANVYRKYTNNLSFHSGTEYKSMLFDLIVHYNALVTDKNEIEKLKKEIVQSGFSLREFKDVAKEKSEEKSEEETKKESTYNIIGYKNKTYAEYLIKLLPDKKYAFVSTNDLYAGLSDLSDNHSNTFTEWIVKANYDLFESADSLSELTKWDLLTQNLHNKIILKDDQEAIFVDPKNNRIFNVDTSKYPEYKITSENEVYSLADVISKFVTKAEKQDTSHKAWKTMTMFGESATSLHESLGEFYEKEISKEEKTIPIDETLKTYYLVKGEQRSWIFYVTKPKDKNDPVEWKYLTSMELVDGRPSLTMDYKTSSDTNAFLTLLVNSSNTVLAQSDNITDITIPKDFIDALDNTIIYYYDSWALIKHKNKIYGLRPNQNYEVATPITGGASIDNIHGIIQDILIEKEMYGTKTKISIPSDTLLKKIHRNIQTWESQI